MLKTFKVVYYLISEDIRNGNTKGVTFVEARDKWEASHRFKQMGIRFHTIDKIEEL